MLVFLYWKLRSRYITLPSKKNVEQLYSIDFFHRRLEVRTFMKIVEQTSVVINIL